MQLHFSEDGVKMQLGTSAGIAKAEEVTTEKQIPEWAINHIRVFAGAVAAKKSAEAATQKGVPPKTDSPT